MSVITVWGINLPIKNDIVRARIDYDRQQRDTWLGGVSGARCGVRTAWDMTLCAMPRQEAEFWRTVFSAQGTSLPWADQGPFFFSSGTRGPALLQGGWTSTATTKAPPPGFGTMYRAGVQSNLRYKCLFDTSAYTLVYDNGGLYGAETYNNTFGANSAGVFFNANQELNITPGQNIADLLWLPVEAPDSIIEQLIAYGNNGGTLSGFERLPMSGLHFKNKLTWQVPIPSVVKMEPTNNVGEPLFEVSIGFGDVSV